MTARAPAVIPHPPGPRPVRVPVVPRDALLLAPAIALALAPLASFWSANADYAYGWFVPFLALYLFWERWDRRPTARPGRLSLSILGVLLVGGGLTLLVTRLLLETEPAWRPALWAQALWVVGALGGWVFLRGGSPWLRHFSFPIAFLLLGVPWIFGLELVLVQDLMRLNASWVAAALVLADVPARAAGNTILLATGQLDVATACSGIRSLQAGLMMSVFLGEFYRLTPGRRFLLVALGGAAAMAGNGARLLFLALEAACHGIASVEAAHDSAGLAVLVFTLAALWLLAFLLAPPSRPSPWRRLQSVSAPPNQTVIIYAASLLVLTIASEAATRGWYAWRESTAPQSPSWTVAWPVRPDLRSVAIPRETHELLEDNASQAATWTDDQGCRWTACWLRFGGRRSNKITLDAHNPEVCLTSVGWRKLSEGAPFEVEAAGLRLRVLDYQFENDGGRCRVFWIVYRHGGVGSAHGDLYGTTPGAFLARTENWARDVWLGCRGLDAETLEVTLQNAPADPEARRVLADFLRAAVRPG